MLLRACILRRRAVEGRRERACIVIQTATPEALSAAFVFAVYAPAGKMLVTSNAAWSLCPSLQEQSFQEPSRSV